MPLNSAAPPVSRNEIELSQRTLGPPPSLVDACKCDAPEKNGALLSRQADTNLSATNRSPNGDSAVTEDGEKEDESIDLRGFVLLLIQRASSSWSYRSAEFAFPLYLVHLFTDSLLPSSIYGFVTTAAGILFSNSTASLVDTYSHRKVKTVQAFVLGQKLLAIASFALFFVIFGSARLTANAQNNGRGPSVKATDGYPNADVWAIFAAITTLGCLLLLSNVGVSVAVEREWVTIISEGSPRRLSRLNAYMRRIDLLSKLLAPLFVSALTSADYRLSAIILLALCGATLVFELIFLPIVFHRFPLLAKDQRAAEARRTTAKSAQHQEQVEPMRRKALRTRGMHGSTRWARRWLMDWSEFAAMPIFMSSVSISLLYMTVLSFDSTFIAYLKTQTDYSDAFVAGMRAVCVVTELLGTVIGPFLEGKIGLVRAGTWSLWAELLPLSLPVVALFTVGTQHHPPPWNTAILFTGLALSRVGLWSFDLCQLAQVQTSLSAHPRRNALQGLQFSLQNAFDLGHYGLTLGWNRPDQFKYAAAASFGAVGAATFVYVAFYARRLRGHVLHLETMERLLPRKTQ
ncbi:hypothetical protein K437DRAFT_170018 [Tilletiaria anomala UBC 951]|uniref:Solute carrier family 40 member n=1 Tax=Tilletiaria anomala (strain ATCC 24038 / CBS 436.72 / UBC 951) TaxID=1037660 RepID=A0A066VNB9_TILAU|nr:uncharacterized protein K437DRAFT_170018 [Tilletiaria anomala UBC 951]KDN41773.1 hypothetical protein K437DRAFT_170018 [Tilletiaria anomala UBC 951]